MKITVGGFTSGRNTSGRFDTLTSLNIDGSLCNEFEMKVLREDHIADCTGGQDKLKFQSDYNSTSAEAINSSELQNERYFKAFSSAISQFTFT
jgi:hypothetical protein